MAFSSHVFRSFLVAMVLGVGGLWMWGCDAIPGVDQGGRQSPSVFALRVEPDSVHGNDLSSQADQDTIELFLAAKASDPDGEIDRVLFTVEPASNPRGTAFGQLQPVEDAPHAYARNLALLVPTTLDEIYTIRVFAVDTDSLSSNQVTGQVRVVPAESSDTAAGSSFLSSPEPLVHSSYP